MNSFVKCHFNCGDDTLERSCCQCYGDYLMERDFRAAKTPPFYFRSMDEVYYALTTGKIKFSDYLSSMSDQIFRCERGVC